MAWADDEIPSESWLGDHEASRTVAEILKWLVAKHFPDAKIHRFGRKDDDDHTDIDGIRFYPRDERYTPTKPPYISVFFSINDPELFRQPSNYEKKLGTLQEVEQRRQDLMDDIWKIVEGHGADCISERNAPGVDPYINLQRPTVGTSSDPGDTCGSIGIYGDSRELIDKMRDNIEYHHPEFDDLLKLLPPRGRSRQADDE